MSQCAPTDAILVSRSYYDSLLANERSLSDHVPSLLEINTQQGYLNNQALSSLPLLCNISKYILIILVDDAA